MRRAAALAAAAWACCGAGCDVGSHASLGGGGGGGGSVEAVLVCQVPATAPSLGGCVAKGAAGIACNPVTSAPCTSGQTCDVTSDSSGNITGFACYDGPNDAALCGPCSVASGPNCAAGLSCADVTATSSACARFCCADADCGAGRCAVTDAQGRSLFGTIAAGLGLCASPSSDAGI